MSFWSIVETLFLGPLKLVFEVIFSVVYKGVGNIGLTIFLLSMAINVLVLPLYMCADKMQEKARNKEEELKEGLTHIKKTFTGDEKMMMVQTYYKQNNYSPLSALSGAVSLLLEIPFFMAAFQFLSSVSLLNGATLGPISNLADPDGLIKLGSLSVNVLPILMTVINIVSSSLYLKGAPLKSKIQLYAMATFFLIFLYNSPAGLVFYWTLNNTFSLVKNIFYKLKNPKKKISITISALGVLVIILTFALNVGTTAVKVWAVIFAVLMQLPVLIPLIAPFLKDKIKLNIKNPFLDKDPKPNKKVFWFGCGFLAILMGILIPTNLIAASPQEFVDVANYVHPLTYVLRSACMAIGTFLIWIPVFYWLASKKAKVIFDKIIWVFCFVTLINYLFFGTKMGTISSSLQYENRFFLSVLEMVLNSIAVIIIVAGTYLFITKLKRATVLILVTAVVAVGGMSVPNFVKITNGVKKIDLTSSSEEIPEFTLTKTETKRNVVVIMLDRAMGAYAPYIFNELPELKEQFEGFIYYDNVISYGRRTNFASPALLGGYEYTPVELNKSSKSLKELQNEANLVLPEIFLNEGYKVTVSDPIYLNYQWLTDLSVINDNEKFKDKDIVAVKTAGKFVDDAQRKGFVYNNNRNFFCFSVMKSMPLVTQSFLYDKGFYNKVETNKDKGIYSIQTDKGISKSTGLCRDFMSNYNTMTNLETMTKITDTDKNTYLFISNNITHEPMLLNEEKGYLPEWEVDNTKYDKEHIGRFVDSNGRVLNIENSDQMMHYHANVSALINLGKWFDYMRDNGVYDNTKIIVCSDHGWFMDAHDELNYANGKIDASSYFPLLLVKDFNAKGFSTNSEFMTNADVPYLATQHLTDPVNPYTQNPINKEVADQEKTGHSQYIIISDDWDVNKYHGNSFTPSYWVEVDSESGLWNKGGDSWIYYNGKKVVLKNHENPY